MAASDCRKSRREIMQALSLRLQKEWVPVEQGKHICACGCGKQITVKWHHYYDGIPAFCLGHRTPHLGLNTMIQRFWKRVKKTETCWLWTGAKWERYGKFFAVQNHPCAAHRFSYEMHFGPIPRGLGVMHSCDVTLCIRPQHLSLGTQLENMLDCKSKGRIASGSRKVISKLSEEIVSEMRQLYTSGQASVLQLANRFGVTRGTAGMAVAGRTWKHVPMLDSRESQRARFLPEFLDPVTNIVQAPQGD